MLLAKLAPTLARSTSWEPSKEHSRTASLILKSSGFLTNDIRQYDIVFRVYELLLPASNVEDMFMMHQL